MNLNSNWTYCNLEIPSPEGRGCSPGAPRLAVLHGLRGGREGIQLPCWGPACLIPSCMDWAAAPIQWPWEGVSGNVSVWEHCGASRSSSGETKLVEKPSSPAHLSGAVLWARLAGPQKTSPHASKLSQIPPFPWPVQTKFVTMTPQFGCLVNEEGTYHQR